MFLTCIYRFQARIMMNFKISKFGTCLNDINDDLPLCSVLIGDFNARNSWLWKNNITNSSGLELDSLTSSAGYRQIIDKLTHPINDIGLIFCANLNVIFKHNRYFYFDKYHHDIIYGKINIRVPLNLYIFVKSGITRRQMLKKLKKQYLTLVKIKFFKISL